MRRSRLVLAVTSPASLTLLNGLPDYLSRRWDVHVVVGGPTGPVAGACVHELQMRRDPAPWSDAVALLRWVRLLHELRPAIVVAGTPKAGLLGVVAGWLTRVPRRVYWLRGLRAETASGTHRMLLMVLERVCIALSTEVLVVSQSLAAEAKRHRLGPAGKFVVLGSGSSNGVAVERFAAVRRDRKVMRGFGLDPDLPTVGFVGRITRDKGVASLVEAVLDLHAGGQAVQLFLVGACEDPALVTELEAVLTAAAVPHTYVMHLDDVTSAYSAMDLLCLPSRREGFPNVVLESAAAGLPSVCTDVTGCRDAVVDGVTGWLTPPDDASCLAERIGELLGDPAMRTAMGAAARIRAKSEFDRMTVWQRLDEFFECSVAGPIEMHEFTDVSDTAASKKGDV